MPDSKFLRVICPRCKRPHTLFGKSSTKVKCPNCNKLLTKTTGGKVKVKARITGVL